MARKICGLLPCKGDTCLGEHGEFWGGPHTIGQQRIRQWNTERENALGAARLAAQQRVHTAQTALEAQAAEARKQIETTAGQLAAQVLAAVLPSTAAESMH